MLEPQSTRVNALERTSNDKQRDVATWKSRWPEPHFHSWDVLFRSQEVTFKPAEAPTPRHVPVLECLMVKASSSVVTGRTQKKPTVIINGRLLLPSRSGSSLKGLLSACGVLRTCRHNHKQKSLIEQNGSNYLQLIVTIATIYTLR